MPRFDLTALWQGNADLTALYSLGFLWHAQRFASLSAESGWPQGITSNLVSRSPRVLFAKMF